MIMAARRQNVHSRWFFGSLCLILFSANPSIFALPGGGGMMVGVDAAPTSTSYSEERRRERRRREREQRRQQSKPHPGRKNKPIEKDGEQSFDFEDMKTNVMTRLSMLQQPKDVFEGTIKALQSVFLGASVGLVSALGIPLLALYSQLRTDEGRPENPSPVLGFIVGAIMGGITGTVSTLAGIATAVFQLGAGVWNTFGAFQAALKGMRWDERTRTWAHYSLEQEAEELNIGSSSSSTKRTASNVQDTGFYDMLGVQPNASGKDIKKAYYQKAKVMHPDKNPEDPEKAAEDFLKLHAAYQTLSDDKKRADYDKWGISGDDNGGAGGSVPFDVSVFFAVMFDFQRVEPYIGELTIASFIDGIIKLSQMASQNQNLNEGLPPFIFEQLWGNDTQPRKRQVEIAQNLLSRIDEYVAGTQTVEEFRQSAADEADTIIDGGRNSGDGSSGGDLLGFTDKLLDTIGAGLVLEAGHYLAFHQRKPFLVWPVKGTLYAASRKKNKWAQRMRSATKTFQLVRKAFTNGAIQFDRNSENEKESDDNVDKEKAMEDLLPDLIDTAGAYILSDISKAVQGACWRLFFDSGAELDTRLRRAEALNILGHEFLRRGERTTSSGSGNNTEECADKSARSEGAKDRIMRAFEISQMKAQGDSSFHEE